MAKTSLAKVWRDLLGTVLEPSMTREPLTIPPPPGSKDQSCKTDRRLGRPLKCKGSRQDSFSILSDFRTSPWFLGAPGLVPMPEGVPFEGRVGAWNLLLHFGRDRSVVRTQRIDVDGRRFLRLHACLPEDRHS